MHEVKSATRRASQRESGSSLPVRRSGAQPRPPDRRKKQVGSSRSGKYQRPTVENAASSDGEPSDVRATAFSSGAGNTATASSGVEVSHSGGPSSSQMPMQIPTDGMLLDYSSSALWDTDRQERDIFNMRRAISSVLAATVEKDGGHTSHHSIAIPCYPQHFRYTGEYDNNILIVHGHAQSTISESSHAVRLGEQHDDNDGHLSSETTTFDASSEPVPPDLTIDSPRYVAFEPPLKLALSYPVFNTRKKPWTSMNWARKSMIWTVQKEAPLRVCDTDFQRLQYKDYLSSEEYYECLVSENPNRHRERYNSHPQSPSGGSLSNLLLLQGSHPLYESLNNKVLNLRLLFPARRQKPRNSLAICQSYSQEHLDHARDAAGLAQDEDESENDEMGLRPPPALSWARWKLSTGRAKSWKHSRYMKITSKSKSELRTLRSKLGICKPQGVALPRYLLSENGYRIKHPLVSRKRPVSYFAREENDAELRGARHHMDQGDTDGCDEYVSLHQVSAGRAHMGERNETQVRLRTVEPSISNHTTLRHENYIGAIVAPAYELIRQVWEERHSATYFATNLHDQDTYQLTLVNILGLPGKEKSYRVKLLKKLQRDRRVTDHHSHQLTLQYLSTVSQHGMIWVIHRLPLGCHPHYLNATYKQQQEVSRQSRNKNLDTVSFLQKGTQQFREAFPHLPKLVHTARTTTATVRTTPAEAQQLKREKRQTAQRLRRSRKRAQKASEKFVHAAQSQTPGLGGI